MDIISTDPIAFYDRVGVDVADALLELNDNFFGGRWVSERGPANEDLNDFVTSIKNTPSVYIDDNDEDQYIFTWISGASLTQCDVIAVIALTTSQIYWDAYEDVPLYVYEGNFNIAISGSSVDIISGVITGAYRTKIVQIGAAVPLSHKYTGAGLDEWIFNGSAIAPRSDFGPDWPSLDSSFDFGGFGSFENGVKVEEMEDDSAIFDLSNNELVFYGSGGGIYYGGVSRMEFNPWNGGYLTGEIPLPQFYGGPGHNTFNLTDFTGATMYAHLGEGENLIVGAAYGSEFILAGSSTGETVYRCTSWNGNPYQILDVVDRFYIDDAAIRGGRGMTVIGHNNGLSIAGSSGADTITSGAGDDAIDGGGGFDIANFSGNRSSYTVTKTGSGFTVSTTGRTDTVTNVEYLQFADTAITISPANTFDEYTALLYQGALGRTPDPGGLAGWINLTTALPAATQAMGVYGLSDASGNYNGSLSIAAGFTNSPEFIAKYGSLTNEQFVTQLYANILDRAPDAGGLAGWLNFLTQGATREHLLIGFALSQEAIANATVGYVGIHGQHDAWLMLS